MDLVVLKVSMDLVVRGASIVIDFFGCVSVDMLVLGVLLNWLVYIMGICSEAVPSGSALFV